MNKMPQSALQTRRPQRRYDWSAWMDGQWHELYRGEHFDTAVSVFQNHVYRAASTHGKRARTHHLRVLNGKKVKARHDDGLEGCPELLAVQFYADGEAPHDYVP